MADISPLRDLEGAEKAFNRVQQEIDAVDINSLSTMNVDVVAATSIVLGVAERVRSFRDRIAKLPEFDMQNLDKLVDYALAAWFSFITNLPQASPEAMQALMQEVVALRAKLLMWAVPLVGSGVFEQAAIDRIKEGSGNKDAPSDLVALVGLYRSRWDAVKGMCGVTEADLDRGSVIGPELFGMVSRKENQLGAGVSDGTLRVRKSFTKLDLAYDQCRRAIGYLQYDQGDLEIIAPNIRRNAGPRGAAEKAAAKPPADPTSTPTTPTAPLGGAPIGGNTDPFKKN